MLEQLPSKEWVDLLAVRSIVFTGMTGNHTATIATEQGVKHEVDFTLHHKMHEWCDDFGARARAAQEAQQETLLASLGQNISEAAGAKFTQALGAFSKLRAAAAEKIGGRKE